MTAGTSTSHGTGVSIDWCATGKIPTLQALIDSNWRKGHILARDADLLRWQYRHPSEPDQLSVLLAEHEGEPVGMLGLIPCGFCIRGERVPGAWVAMWLTVPEWRARRVGLSLLRELFARNFGMIGVLGVNQQTTGGIYQALGFTSRDVVPRWVRVISPGSLENLVAAAADQYPPAIRAAWSAGARHPRTLGQPTARLVDWTEESAARWDRAWRERFAPRLIGTWRDAAYLRWRYVDHPRFRYELRFAEDPSDGSLAGLLVYRIETVRDRSERVLRIVEYLSAETVGAALTQAVLSEGEERDVAFADFFCTSPAFTPDLEAAGFVREETLPVPLPSRFQPLDFHHTSLNGVFWISPDSGRDGHAFFETPELYVTRSDGDQDRPS